MYSLTSGTTVFVDPMQINLTVLITGTDLQLTSRLCIPCVDNQFLTITRARMKIWFWLSRRLGLFLLSFFFNFVLYFYDQAWDLVSSFWEVSSETWRYTLWRLERKEMPTGKKKRERFHVFIFAKKKEQIYQER